jgi:hypothetical protein
MRWPCTPEHFQTQTAFHGRISPVQDGQRFAVCSPGPLPEKDGRLWSTVAPAASQRLVPWWREASHCYLDRRSRSPLRRSAVARKPAKDEETVPSKLPPRMDARRQTEEGCPDADPLIASHSSPDDDGDGFALRRGRAFFFCSRRLASQPRAGGHSFLCWAAARETAILPVMREEARAKRSHVRWCRLWSAIIMR